MELRPATQEEFERLSVAAMTAFHRVFTDEDRERHARIDEPERSQPATVPHDDRERRVAWKR